MAFDYHRAATILGAAFEKAESDYQKGLITPVPEEVVSATETLFASKTQAYREALIGCCLVRIVDDTLDITKPYVGQGDKAYNGRTLDEQVVNPLLQEKEIPCSKGPCLSALRRNISFVTETEKGLRDKEAFRAMLIFIKFLQIEETEKSSNYLVFLMTKFVELRDKSTITLSKVNRLSIEQFSTLIDLLLGSASGGLMPVLLVVSTFEAISAVYGLPWAIKTQGINEADAASGAGGDVTIINGEQVVLAVEVTERVIDEDRVRSTFRTKISPNAIDDYLFFFSGGKPTVAARARAQAYFAQGHEINFAPIQPWIVTVLTTLGAKGRVVFTEKLIQSLDDPKISAAMKVAWNTHIRTVLA